MRLYKPPYTDRTGRKRRASKYWCQVGIDGRDVRFSTEQTDKRKAKAVAETKIGEMRVGTYIDSRKLTYTEIMDALKDDYAVNGKRSADRLGHARKALDSFFQHYRAANVTTAAIRKYQRQRLDDVTPATVNREVGYLRRALRLALEDGRLARVPHFPMLAEPKARDVTIENDGQLAALLAALPEHHRQWVALAAYTGWRRNAILSRTWADITKDSDGRRWLSLDRKSSKNAEHPRPPIVGDVARILDEQRVYVDRIERRTRQVVRWCFPYLDGRPIRYPDVAFKKAAEAAGCPGLHVHDLRRFAVSRMVELGIAEADVMALAGMETRSILDRYNVVNERRKVAAVEKLTGALDAKPTKKKIASIDKRVKP